MVLYEEADRYSVELLDDLKKMKAMAENAAIAEK